MTSVMPTVIRVAVILMAIAGTAGHVAYLDALWWHSLGLTGTVARNVSPALLMLLTAHAVVSIVSAVFAVLLVLREGSRADAARALGMAFGAWSYLMSYSGVTILLRPDPGAGRDLFEAHFLLVEVIGLAGLVRFTTLFPSRLVPHEVHAPPALPAVLRPFHLFSVWMLRPAAPWGLGLAILVALWAGAIAVGGVPGDAGLSPFMDVVRLGAAGLVVLNLRRAWGLADTEGRERLHWLLVALTCLLGAIALLIGGNVLVAVTGFPEPNVAWRPLLLDVGLVGFLTGLALSVLHHGATNPRRLMRAIGSVCAITTLALFLAAGLEALFGGGIFAAFRLRTGVGSALAVATILSTYRGIQRLLDRLVP
jgi:hypothetical protein